jgi:hypothetical protein
MAVAADAVAGCKTALITKGRTNANTKTLFIPATLVVSSSGTLIHPTKKSLFG